MKISATSALVLNWSDKALWQSTEALDYLQKLDLSEGEPLLRLFSQEENYMHSQSVSCRKFFVLQRVFQYLDKLKSESRQGQVLILAAGLAPMSVEIAAQKPSSMVFDIDKFHMNEKKQLVNGRPGNIAFIDCDITNVEDLNHKLLENGYNPEQPGIAILEGITYYILRNDLRNLFNYFHRQDMAVTGEFGLQPESVNKKTRIYLTEVFRKIKEQVHLDFVTYYREEEMQSLLEDAGYEHKHMVNLQDIQKERTGNIYPFEEKDSGWVRTFFAE